MVATLASASPASACPDCTVGRLARAEVWRDGVARYVLVAALPFALIGAVCARVDRIGRRRNNP